MLYTFICTKIWYIDFKNFQLAHSYGLDGKLHLISHTDVDTNFVAYITWPLHTLNSAHWTKAQ